MTGTSSTTGVGDSYAQVPTVQKLRQQSGGHDDVSAFRRAPRESEGRRPVEREGVVRAARRYPKFGHGVWVGRLSSQEGAQHAPVLF